MYFRGNYLLVIIHISQHLTYFVLLINTQSLVKMSTWNISWG